MDFFKVWNRVFFESKYCGAKFTHPSTTSSIYFRIGRGLSLFVGIRSVIVPPLGQGPDGDVRRGAEQVPVVSEHVLHRHPLPGEDSAAEQALLGVTHVLQQTLLHLNPGYDRLAVLANGFSSGA